MRPGLDDTLAAPVLDATRTETAPRVVPPAAPGPRLRGAAIRVVLPVAVPMAGSLIEYALGFHGQELDTIPEVAFAVTLFAPPIALLWASLRSVSKPTVWDKLSRTMVRYRTHRPAAI